MASEVRPTLLFVVHAWGGGVIHYARLLRNHVASRVNVVFAWGIEDRWFHISARDPESPDQSFDLADGIEAPLAALRALDVRRVDLLCTIGLQAHVGTLLDRLAVPFDVTFQAYELLANNNTHLLGQDGHYLGERAVSALANSIERSRPVEHVLRTADRRIACSRDLAWRASRLLPGYPILPVRPPEPGEPHKVVPTLPILRAHEPLRVLVLGRLAPHKGLGVIREVARIADAESFPIELLCLGEPQVPPSDLPASPRVRILGRYDVDALKTIVPPLRPHLAWLPFVWPETHSFVLSEVMALGLPVLATGIGAVPERVEGRAATWLLPLEEASPEGFFRWFERLARERLATPPQWMPTGHLPPLVPDFYARDYLAPLCGREPARAGFGARPLRRVYDGYKTIRRLLGRSRKGIPGTGPKFDTIAPRTRAASPRPKAPDASVWDELARSGRAPRPPAVVDVIVPVYRGHDDTLACLHSVLANRNTTAYELVVIDDAGPEPDLAGALDAIAARGLIDLVRNKANQGFVRSVNAGMARHPDRDAILLNSDTIVYGDWIDRLRAHRLGKTKIGTITPWSNNATLLSYPVTFESNNFDLEIDFAALDRLAAGELAGEACELPTGVGFCLYVSRDCLDDVGAFNADAFGRGYGEENDFCLRAAARGWRNIAACDVFVRHTGEVSFRTDAAEAQRRAAAALLELHPRYMELIAAFMRADPLRPYRERLDLARLRRWGSGRLVVRFGDDGSGGGDAPIEDAARVVHVCPSPDDAEAFVMKPVADLVLPNLPRLPIGDAEAAARLLFGLGAVGARMKASTGLTANQARFAREICAKLGQPC
jgi:GT2 family glycosyltransferase/glycosyltransferase involved in cell wall biosynthesis